MYNSAYKIMEIVWSIRGILLESNQKEKQIQIRSQKIDDSHGNNRFCCIFFHRIYAPKEKWYPLHGSLTESPSVFHVDIQGDQSHPLYRKFVCVLVDNTDTDGIYGSSSMHQPQITSTLQRNWASNPSWCGNIWRTKNFLNCWWNPFVRREYYGCKSKLKIIESNYLCWFRPAIALGPTLFFYWTLTLAYRLSWLQHFTRM